MSASIFDMNTEICAHRIWNNCNFKYETRRRRFAFLISGKGR